MDRIRTFVDQYKAQHSSCVSPLTFEDALVLQGLIDLYRASGDPSDRQWVLDRMAQWPDAVPGKALFFALDETGDERWRRAADQLHERLPDLPDGAEDLYLTEPFRTEYDSRWLSGLEAAGIARRFKNAGPQAEDRSDLFLAALIDCIEVMPEQLYEHRRVLMDLFLAGAQEILTRTGEPESRQGRAWKAYVLLKGVRLGQLDPERYLAPGLKAFQSLKDQLPDDNCPGETGPFMMAWSEQLRQ